MDGNQIELNLWDSAGDANIHNLVHLFVKKVKVVCLCYSIDSKASFEELWEWYEDIKESDEQFFIVIVGCRSDLEA